MMRKTLLAVVVLFALSAGASAQQVFYPGNGVTLPTVIKEIHLMGATDATIGIDCVVGADGTVTSATVASSPDPTLNDAAVRALRKWQFSPGMKNGKAVAVHIFVELSIERI